MPNNGESEAIEQHHAIDDVIRRRSTEKVLGDIASPISIPADFGDEVDEIVSIAGWAPFHFPADTVYRQGALRSCVPWRFYVLKANTCRQLAHYLMSDAHVERPLVENAKIIRMLAAAGALVIVTWLPEPGSDGCLNDEVSKGARKRNEEHLAAAAAAAQNVLLLGTARRMKTYWSSGGILNSADVYKMCAIDPAERFLAGLFLTPESMDACDVVTGKFRHQRGDVTDWSREINLD